MSELPFTVVKASTVASVLKSNTQIVYGLVKESYMAFGDERAENPNSLFLTFNKLDEHSPNRIIALPAYVNAASGLGGGIKWISSFPKNIERGLPRASAVLVLNDLSTGFPYACLEGAHISAARTAASAVLGAEVLCNGDRSARTVGFVGTGVIAQSILDCFLSLDWSFDEVHLYDLDADRTRMFQAANDDRLDNILISISIDELIKKCDLIVFATTASSPHVTDASLFRHNPRVLHISLRDLSPAIILESHNVVDDAEHCLKARTSIHLASEVADPGHFIAANIYNCFDGAGALIHQAPRDRPAVFSPFGMGILDIALAMFICRNAVESGEAVTVPGFFSAH
ncbi:2,3-diaminopropionate biosynthesis protein SbnB [Agrobacterium tumefaciens]|uniref:2,3-diaminopropionate biosynthesis protein SbnB n=1 Tax=Agrobacterium tumefaciens TaxID=358 RepID=UPI00224453EC|nr:2,3-diaminopropionate biosynthesis protein SbnB [Agrobacterium tumefaciens]MCW8060198.1 2,3-diaminopropionate biosynthesis protein SbnB [Agrobacterium tumefaciens]